MKTRTLLGLALALASSLVVHAADLTGRWTSRFDSQIGEQNYVYVFATADGHLTGSATYAHSMGKGEVKLQDIKLDGDQVSFSETVNLGGNKVVITYAGQMEGDALKLTRQVGEFATEEITAQRAAPAKP